MITINTSIIKRGSFKEKLKNFADNFIRPYNKGWMKRLSERLKELKKDAIVENIRVLFPKDVDVDKRLCSLSEPIRKNEIKFEEIDGKWSKQTRTFFLVRDKEYPLFDNNIYYAYSITRDDCSHGYYIYEHNIDMWLDVTEFQNTKPFFKNKYRYINITYDDAAYMKYKALYYLQRSISKVCGWIYSFFHTIDSCILCIRFPFLYPRNRFTDKHYNNWKIQSLVDEYNKQGTARVNARFPKNEDGVIRVDELPEILKKENDVNKTLYTYYFIGENGDEIVVNDKARGIQIPIRMDIDNEKTYWAYDRNHGWIDITHSEAYDTPITFEHDDYNSVYTTFIIDKNIVRKAKMLNWFHTHILGNIFFIPTSNELDALDEGWKRRFGIDICKEIKAELKANNCLYSYRIEQIKEKYGALRWYDQGGTQKIFDIIEKYERISAHTCISCGEEAEYITRGWICPYCSNCIDPNQKDYADRIVDGKIVHGKYYEEPELDETAE